MAPSQQPQKALGLAIRQLREKSGKTQEAVAHEAEITASTLSVIERGESNPTWATVAKIAAAVGVSVIEVAKLTVKLEA